MLEHDKMNKLIKEFLKLAEDESSGLNMKSLLTEDETLEWEVLVKALDSIDILNIGKALEKLSKTYQLERWQELSILAYVKILELMMKRAKDTGAFEGIPLKKKPTEREYSGSMFG